MTANDGGDEDGGVGGEDDETKDRGEEMEERRGDGGEERRWRRGEEMEERTTRRKINMEQAYVLRPHTSMSQGLRQTTKDGASLSKHHSCPHTLVA
jgi:hypothetical protein